MKNTIIFKKKIQKFQRIFLHYQKFQNFLYTTESFKISNIVEEISKFSIVFKKMFFLIEYDLPEIPF